jgi:hypothetical protein
LAGQASRATRMRLSLRASRCRVWMRTFEKKRKKKNMFCLSVTRLPWTFGLDAHLGDAFLHGNE